MLKDVEIYKPIPQGFIELPLRDMRKFFDIFVCLGCNNMIQELWEIKQIDWDLDHIENKIEELLLERFQ